MTDLAVGDRLDLRVDRPAFGGGVIAEAHDGRVVFLRGAAPGDRVVAEVTEVRPRFVRAEVRSVEPGTLRVAPFCAHVERCGGCPWMAIPEAAQQAALAAHVEHALGRAAGSGAPRFEPIVSVPPRAAWRSTARLHWRAGALGYRAAGSHAVVDIPECAVLRPPLPALYAALRARLGPHLAGEGTVRLTAAPDAASGTVEFRPEGAVSGALREAIAGLVDDPACHGAVLLEGGRARAFGRAGNTLGGVEHPAGSFVQAHQDGNAALVEAVVEAVVAPTGAGPVLGPVLELYAGSGNFTFALAARGCAVTAVEVDRAAAAALREAARARGLGDRVRAVTGDAARLPAGRFPVALIDPPRAGAKAAVDALARLDGLRRIVYVSCNPATLARDVARLVARGWRLDRARPFDLFPHTGHVEVLAVLQRG